MPTAADRVVTWRAIRKQTDPSTKNLLISIERIRRKYDKGMYRLTDTVRPWTEEEIVAGVPVWITDDVPAARAATAQMLQIYGQLPSYRAVLDREGMAGPEDMLLAGDPDTVRAGLAEYAAAGATEVAMSVFGGPESADAVFELAAAMVKES